MADCPTTTLPNLNMAGETVTMAGWPTLPTSDTVIAWVEVLMVALEVKRPTAPVASEKEITTEAPGCTTAPVYSPLTEKGGVCAVTPANVAGVLPTFVTVTEARTTPPPSPPVPKMRTLLDKVRWGPG